MSCPCNEVIVDRRFGSIVCNSTGNLNDDDFINSPCYDCSNEQLIEVRGVTSGDELEKLTIDSMWKQIFMPEFLCIPSQKPNVEQVMSIHAFIKIISQRVIKTPVVVDANGNPIVTQENYEGTLLTGRKLVIEGVLKQKIMYTAAVPEQSVHSAHFDVPFSVFIILSKDTPLTTKFKIEPYIEDIFVCNVSERQIFKNVTIFINAKPLTCGGTI